MQFFYHKDAKNPEITLSPQDTHYLFRVRRFKEGATLRVRNLRDNTLYIYQHIISNNSSRNKQAYFKLIEAREDIQDKTYHLMSDSKNIGTTNFPIKHSDSRIQGLLLILAIIDIKDIYDILPILNALNISSLYLFYADFSQKNRVLDIQKAYRILEYSCMQCGRIRLMEIVVFKNLQEVLSNNKEACFIDFATTNVAHDFFNPDLTSSNLPSPNVLHKKIPRIESLSKDALRKQAKQGIIIGPEGGFSNRERKILQTKRQYSLWVPHVLTSHVAGVYIASLCCAAYQK